MSMDAKAGDMAPHGEKLALGRLEALVEGVFAIAMTIMVLDIKLPEGASLGSIELWETLTKQSEGFTYYLLSFWLLAVFWVIHNKHFRHLTHTTPPHVWLNMGMLAFVSLVPFSTSLFEVDWRDVTSGAFFAANLFVAGSFLLAAWIYACRQGLVTPELESADRRRIGLMTSLIPLVSLLVLGLAFVIPDWCNLGYLTIPVLRRAAGGR